MSSFYRIKIAAAAALIAVPAAAYQIGTNLPPLAEYLDLHESFTAVARECLGGGSERPVDCGSLLNKANSSSRVRNPKPENREEYASRWPDDPTRMLEGHPSKIRIGLQLNDDCKTALGRGRAVDVAGLLCSGHYGRLQFIHAQASKEDARDTALTRRIILSWARFAYRAATEKEFRDSNYCEALKRKGTDEALRARLSFSSEYWCERRRKTFWGIPLWGHYSPWTVRTLFALQCSNPVQEKICWERGGKHGDETARMAAIGALLHLVQDSYSQAHVARVPEGKAAPGPRGPFAPLVVCSRPSLYYDYEVQNLPMRDDEGNITEDPHGKADFPPTLDRSCKDLRTRSVDDIITASAVVLYYVHPGRKNETEFMTYLENRVFPG
jgi:hypothetical protein